MHVAEGGGNVYLLRLLIRIDCWANIDKAFTSIFFTELRHNNQQQSTLNTYTSNHSLLLLCCKSVVEDFQNIVPILWN